MDIGIPSRFACLNIEDEDIVSSQTQKPKEIKKKPKKPVVSELPKTTNKKADKIVTPKASDSKQATTTVSKKNKKKQEQQWEEWKQKDDELENGMYEEDLRNAILLSKLDFEHNKDVYTKPAEEPTKPESNKKKKKNKTIGLDKFLSNGEKQKQTNTTSTTNNKAVKPVDFFNSIDSDTKAELKKEQINARRKKGDANINDVIALAQYQAKYEEEHRLRLAAQEELKIVKASLASADSKMKTFCKILNQGEMKDKATLLLENQQLTIVKNELTESVSNLHALLEKERSKVASLTSSLNNKGKQKEKKRKGN